MVALLKELAAHSPGLCVCTSRLPLTDLEDYGNAGVLTIDLDNLTPASGAEYLKQLPIQGPDDELREASEEFGNHALALTLLGTLLVKRRNGDIRNRDTIPSLFSDPKKGGHARRVYRQYEVLFKGKPELDVLRILGLFDRPADPGALHILRKIKGDQWAEVLERLKDARLIEYSDPEGYIDSHPLLREHFAEEYRTSNPNAFREAHSQLYEYYCKKAPHQPDTLEAMQPLFYAVYHGCQAGRHQEACDDVYYDRIQHGGGFLRSRFGGYGVNLSLLANFFLTPWFQPAPGLTPPVQSWITSSAAFSLRALGRLAEALEPMRAAADAAVAAKDWKTAAIRFSNVSQVHLALGDIPAALEAARQSVELADRGGDKFTRITRRANLADALHQSGDQVDAQRLLKEAEKMQAELQPSHPILYSLQGYQYCDLLLAQDQTAEVLRRATQALKWASQDQPLLDIALANLSLGRAYPPGSTEAVNHLDEAASGLRKVGAFDHVALGLLARAANFRHLRDFPRAQHDLDEVRILATRCGMRLHLTDYHLEQARLFFAQSQPDAARPHYEAAAKLVDETGYHRRDPELAELKAQLA
jgi:tetratricopeptide (TPR) repeat protein